MPEGRYLSLSGMIRAGTGGQTRALLMRNRLLTQHAGLTTTQVTFDADPVYPEVRESLREQGQLVSGMELLNIFEWYRQNDDVDGEPIAESLTKLEGFVTEDELHPDGTVYRTKYLHERSRTESAHDYRRPDGSVYLRTPAGPGGEKTPATTYVLCNRQGVPVHSWKRKGAWYRLWLRTLAGDAERVFMISDSRFALAHIVPMRDPRFHILHLMHNTHTVGERRWDSKLSLDYGKLLDGIHKIDGLVTLTRRQREDVIERYGETNNLFVVPNPVELPELPDVMPQRARARFAVVSRLERQKQLDHAVQAFALVLKEEPEARLDIYGDGNLRVPLQTLIDGLGIGHAVTLCGHSPHARENLLTATGFLMTSLFEGYPLASLESMSRGCPVVSYDIKYGPREQISDGVDGFVTPPGDMQTFADRVVTMIRDPALVASMSAAALEKAQLHDYRAFLDDWRVALEAAVANKPSRVQLDRVELNVNRLGLLRAGRLPRRLVRPRAWPAAFHKAPEVEFEGAVHLHGRGRRETLDDVRVTMDAVCDATGAVLNIPILVRRIERRFDLRARFDVGEVFGQLGQADSAVRLRLRVVWNNASWETNLARPQEQRAPIELNYAADDTLLLSRSSS